MNRKYIQYCCAVVMLGLVASLASYWHHRVDSTYAVSVRQSAEPAGKPNQIKALDIQTSARLVKEGKRTDPTAVVMSGSRSGADYALVQVAFKHPELGLTPEVAGALQEIFSYHYRTFADYQAAVAQVTQQSDGSILIKVPAFPTQGKQLMANLVNDIEVYYNGNAPKEVVSAIQEIYEGHTNAAGAAALNLTVKAIDNSSNYAVSRDIVFYDRATGLSRGSGHTDNVLTKESLNDGQYSTLSKFFPQPKG